MRTFLLSLALAFAFFVPLRAQQPTFAKDVASILYTHCSNCHRPGGIGTFSLLSYQDAYNRAADIASYTQSRTMPPWPPDPRFNRLGHERLLSAMDIQTIQHWVSGGAPRGDSTQEPQPPVFNPNSELSSVDLSVVGPAYTSQADSSDIYRCFVVPSGLTADQFVTALEVLPSNRGIVHHVLVYVDVTGEARKLDSADAGPGYTSFGGIGVNSASLLGGWVPGGSPTYMPGSMGISLPANADLVLQIHFPAGTKGKIDSTRVNMKLTASPSTRQVYIAPALNHDMLDQGKLFIPANTQKLFTCHYKVPFAASLINVMPHMHLIGKSIKVYAITPQGDTIPMVDIPDWDFHWQGFYTFRNVMKLPMNSTLHSEAWYDNTTDNEDNPNHPPKDVSVGEATTDEMMLVYFSFTAYFPGDENIVQDTSSLVNLTDTIVYSTTGYLEPVLSAPPSLFPNPATTTAWLSLELQNSAPLTVQVYNPLGQLLLEPFRNQQLEAGNHMLRADVSGLATGTYLCRITVADRVVTQRLVVLRQ